MSTPSSHQPEFAIPQLPTKRIQLTPTPIPNTTVISTTNLSSTNPTEWPQSSTELKDASVQGTSDDAAVSKCSARTLNYFSDEFLTYFVPQHQQTRRPPLINRGYWARVAAVTQMIHEFLIAGEEGEMTSTSSTSASASFAAAAPASSTGPSIPSTHSTTHAHPLPSSSASPLQPPPPFPAAPPATIRKQIVSLGAGSDTNYFKLKAANRAPYRYIEIDFPVAMTRKAQTIRQTPRMLELVQQRSPQQTEEEAERFRKQTLTDADSTQSSLDLPSTDYALVGADLRDLTALEAGLRHAHVDFSLPTLILSECVLIYMSAKDSSKLLEWLTQHFTGGAVLWCYEQIHPFDAFGETMRANLNNRGCSLLGFTAYPDLEAHRQRYLQAGFQYYAGWDMNDIYRFGLQPLSEVKRIERLELFDEFEEWNMIQAHYHISVASMEPKPQSSSESNEMKESESAATTASSSTSTSHHSSIPWSRLGILGKSKSHSLTSPQTHVTSTGRTILLGGAGLRASAPLQPNQQPTHQHMQSTPGVSNTATPAKGSLMKRVPGASTTTTATD